MALNIKDPATEALAAEVARMTGDSKTGAVRTALRERRDRLRMRGEQRGSAAHMMRMLEEEIWPSLGLDEQQPPMTKAEREEILGIGPDGT